VRGVLVRLGCVWGRLSLPDLGSYDDVVTFAPQSLLACRHVFKARFPQISDGDLGIVGGPSHVLTGTSYHLGADQLKIGRDPYSARTARDKAGLSNAASAFDLTDQIGASLLRLLSTWTVGQCRAKAGDTLDIREIIFSPDGNAVLTWDRERGVTSFPLQRGDSSHRVHTHFSWYRDSENRNRHAVFERFFEEGLAHMAEFTQEQIDSIYFTLVQADGWAIHARAAALQQAAGRMEPKLNAVESTLAAVQAKLDTLTTPTVVTDEQLERVLKKVLGSLG
jgi:hypothetical protein